MAPRLSNLTWKIGQRSLAGYRPWSWKDLDMTEQIDAYIFMYVSYTDSFPV